MAWNQKECIICGGKPEKTKFGYTKPDKYEKWIGLKDIKRLWVKCEGCGFHWQLRNYPLSKFDELYKDWYRHPQFRGEDILEAYTRVQFYRITGESENEARYVWFAKNIKFDHARNVLDVGSGLGVWPKILKDAEFYVTCVDTNTDSVDFISQDLGMKCYYDLKDVHGYFDTVTLVHVLEHIQDLDGFLEQIRIRLRNGGYLFVEVPNSHEFYDLDKDHDDFNSTHQWFFDFNNLWKVLERNGFDPFRYGIHTQKGKSRIRMLCN